MILGVQLPRAIEIVGHAHRTKTHELVAALGRHALGSRLVPVRVRPPGDNALVCVQTKGSRSHWAVFAAGRVHDPGLQIEVAQATWFACLDRVGARLTSSLPIR